MESDRAQVDLGEAVDAELGIEEKQQIRQPKRRFVGRKEAAERAEQSGGSSQTVEDSVAVQGR